MRDLTLENPIRAIREISHDITGQQKVRLANGREASALEIQREYFTKARDFAARRGLDEGVVKQVLDLWERTLLAVETGDLDRSSTEIDWVMKYKLIERYSAKHDLALSSSAGRPAGPRLPRHLAGARAVLPAAAPRAGRARRPRPGDLPGQVGPAADDPGPAARRVHPPRAGAPARLHRRLGAPQAQRPGAAHGAVQGPVPLGRRAGGEAHREYVSLLGVCWPSRLAGRTAVRGA